MVQCCGTCCASHLRGLDAVGVGPVAHSADVDDASCGSLVPTVWRGIPRTRKKDDLGTVSVDEYRVASLGRGRGSVLVAPCLGNRCFGTTEQPTMPCDLSRRRVAAPLAAHRTGQHEPDSGCQLCDMTLFQPCRRSITRPTSIEIELCPCPPRIIRRKIRGQPGHAPTASATPQEILDNTFAGLRPSAFGAKPHFLVLCKVRSPAGFESAWSDLEDPTPPFPRLH